MTDAEKSRFEFDFSQGTNTLMNYVEAETNTSKELKRLVRAKEWKHAHLRARGVQSFMEFTLLGSGWNSSPEFIEVPKKLQRLILAGRIAHFENSGKNWYHYHMRVEFAVTKGGYNLSKTVDCEKEPLPFGDAVPWDKAMVEDAEFDIPFDSAESWLQRRLTNQN